MDSGPVASGRQLPTEGASTMCNCTSGNDEWLNRVKWKFEMTGAETLDVARDAIWTIVVVSSPLMVVGLVVGVVVSLFQALTQIQEQTLVFVPKILAIFVTLLLALPFMADQLHSHMMRISSRIIGG
jgi:flagellar biosynthesis protein FliQ